MYTLGYDIGSSAVKAALLEMHSGRMVGAVTWPESEMPIASPEPGWAEQDPEDWWRNIKMAAAILKERYPNEITEIKAVGITYQMHGLVLVNRNHQLLRPSIIWCDSRAAGIGDRAFRELGEEFCLANFLNSPGNFTAAKLRWVKENEPEIYREVYKMMLPGDYIVMKLTGETGTTLSGLSEGIFWNFKKNSIAGELMDHWELDPQLLPHHKPAFSEHGSVKNEASRELGIPSGIPVTYCAGDQPNNAFSLNVLHPGDVAATAGTSGVVYGITDKPAFDPESRVNTFVHVNHSDNQPRYGVLLCVNGTGILNSWLRKTISGSTGITYDEMNELAAQVPPGAEGVTVFPFGNGAERILGNREPGAAIRNVSFTRHDRRHLIRAAQEGIVFALASGMEIMKNMGIQIETIKAGRANMFLSPVFREAFVNTTGIELQLYNTDGAQGAARGAAAGAGFYSTIEDAFDNLEIVDQLHPVSGLTSGYQERFADWKDQLQKLIS